MNICVFEILHFLPLVLIAVTALTFKFNSSPAIPAGILVLSVVGLLSGHHMHTAPEHMEHMSLLDPCVGYAISAVVSVVALVRGLLVSQKA